MKNKKILFFAPSFFGYEIEIKKTLEKMGAIVDFYDERPSNNSLCKILIRLNPKLLEKMTYKYYQKIISLNSQKAYDYVFFIKNESAQKEELNLLKNSFSNAKFILYM